MALNTPQPQDDELLTDEQKRMLDQALRIVIDSPDGEGQVIITIRNGRIRFVQPAPSFDAARPTPAERWARLDAIEKLNRRTR